MIKINLALRKHAAALDSKEKLSLGSLKNFDAEIFKEPVIRKLILAVVVAVMASYLLGGYKDDQLQKLDTAIEKANAENSRAKAELAKTAGYEEQKKQLDSNEQLIKTKLETIQKLLTDRQGPQKLLVSISNGIPKSVWLSEFNLTDKGVVQLKGFSLGFDPITDFMKSLQEGEFMSDVRLGNSQSAKDPVAGEVAIFELEGKRK